MGVFTDAIDKAFERFIKTEDIFKFASDMVDIGDRCRYQWHAHYIHTVLIGRRDDLIPKHVPSSQMMRYLKIKMKKEKGGSSGRKAKPKRKNT